MQLQVQTVATAMLSWVQVLLGALSEDVVQGWSGIASETEDGHDQVRPALTCPYYCDPTLAWLIG